MDIKAAFRIALIVLQDWRVIAIAVAVILYLAFYLSIVSYRKKPKTAAARKKKAGSKPKPAAKPAEASDEDEISK